jgi:membrane protein DedA with SNARE-associated domain
MSQILESLLSYILLYKYVALALLVFANAIVIPLPINTLLLATGAFASQGYLNLGLALVLSIVANILGDCIDYTLARF